MRQLPADLDLSRLIGQKLDSVSLGLVSLSLGFERDHIDCSGRLVAEKDDVATVILRGNDEWGDTSVLPKLLGRNVIAWAVEGSHEFSVSLDDGYTLTFTSRDHPYEDFNIFELTWVV